MPTIDQSDVDFVYGDDILLQQMVTVAPATNGRVAVAPSDGSGGESDEQEPELRRRRLEREPRVESEGRRRLRRGARVSLELGESEERADSDDDSARLGEDTFAVQLSRWVGWHGTLTVSSIEECATPVPSLLEEAPLAAQDATLSPALSLEEHSTKDTSGKLDT